MDCESPPLLPLLNASNEVTWQMFAPAKKEDKTWGVKGKGERGGQKESEGTMYESRNKMQPEIS